MGFIDSSCPALAGNWQWFGTRNRFRFIGIGIAAVSCAQAGAGSDEVRWADRVVFGFDDNGAVYEPGVGTPLTFGPFNPSNPLWQDPESALGQPNSLDYDDLMGFGPVPGGFAGGPMRRINLVWPVWQWGSGEPADLGDRPGWLDGRRQNGVGLTQTAQIVVEFDEPVLNNPDDGGAFHWGVDLIVHGNSAFAADTVISAGSSMNTVLLTGGVFSEAVKVSVAQTAAGPWFTSAQAADALFPTQPWAWYSQQAEWSGDEQDWSKPVDPGLDGSDFSGLTAAEAIELYAGSAGGTPIDFDDLLDEFGIQASLPWARFVRFTDPAGLGGEICGVADVPTAGGGYGCNLSDVAPPAGVLDLADISAFVLAFTTGGELADLAEPSGVFDLADITAFVGAFAGGCP